MAFDQLASDNIIEKTITALKTNGINATVVNDAASAKAKVLGMLPPGAEVMTMQSMTLKETGIAQAINESGQFNSVRKKLSAMDRATQSLEMQKLGAAPEWTVGSVHAVTTDGKLMIASNSGSQLGAYVYASPHIIFVVGTQKIVTDVNEGEKRISEYILPRESERFSQQIGKPVQSNVSKLLIINKEIKPDRITLIFVKERLGF